MTATSADFLLQRGHQVEGLRCEYLVNPIGIDVLHPRFNWFMSSDRPGAKQSAYQLLVYDHEPSEGSKPIWDTGFRPSVESVLVPYGGPDLVPCHRYWWNVTSWDETGTACSTSMFAWWETGFLGTSWAADWIEPGWDEDFSKQNPPPIFRRVFQLPSRIVWARLYSTSRGMYDLRLNAARVGDEVLRPRLTSFNKRLEYQAYDVTDLLVPGENVLGAVVGDGRYRGKVAITKKRNIYGNRVGLLAQLAVRCADGSEILLTTDEQWTSACGPILQSDLKDGEVYDARLDMPGWDSPGYDARDWVPVRIQLGPDVRMDGVVCPPVRHLASFSPIKEWTTPSGQHVFDMGQNFNGRCRLSARGELGASLVLHHGEVLDKKGNFTLANLQTGKQDVLVQRDEYRFRGDRTGETYEPSFTIHGFRYVHVETLGGKVEDLKLEGLAAWTDLPEIGHFECSDPRLNQLARNMTWSVRSNLSDCLMDCPTRERSPYTGEHQILAPTACLMLEMGPYFSHWLEDMRLDQHSSGMVDNIVPRPVGPGGRASPMRENMEGPAGWGDAAVLVPWTVYQAYGDKSILAHQYESMKGWVEFSARRATESRHWTRSWRRKRDWESYLLDTGFHWGEWLEPGKNASWSVARALVFSDAPVATAYFFKSASTLSKIALVLGNQEDAARYANLAASIRSAYQLEFVSDNGFLKPDTQPSYVRALAFGLLKPEQEKPAVARLVALIEQAGTRLATGFLSTQYLLDVLTQHGHLDLAYRLLLQERQPSWLYSVLKGATTIWESWDGLDEQGHPEMSHNHFSIGTVLRWLYGTIAGIEAEPIEAGYRRFRVAPRPGGGLSHASAQLRSPYGMIKSSWRQEENGALRYDLLIPPGTTAEFSPALNRTGSLTINGQLLSATGEGGTLTLLSGRYSIFQGNDLSGQT